MSAQKPKYWFPAKRYGWGWGPPVRWQGWVALALWMAVLLAGVRILISRGPLLFALFVVGMGLVLVGIGYLKGEPPRWRWGGDS